MILLTVGGDNVFVVRDYSSRRSSLSSPGGSKDGSDSGSGDVFAVQSDKHLLSSLSSARGSIVALEVANKDLLDALASRHSELEKMTAECTDWKRKYEDLQGKYDEQCSAESKSKKRIGEL